MKLRLGQSNSSLWAKPIECPSPVWVPLSETRYWTVLSMVLEAHSLVTVSSLPQKNLMARLPKKAVNAVNPGLVPVKLHVVVGQVLGKRHGEDSGRSGNGL